MADVFLEILQKFWNFFIDDLSTIAFNCLKDQLKLSWFQFYKKCIRKLDFIPLISLRERCPNSELFLVGISPYFNWIRRFTMQIYMFCPNAGKNVPRKTSTLGTFTQFIFPFTDWIRELAPAPAPCRGVTAKSC